MKRQQVRFIDVVLAAGPDICLMAVCLYIIGGGLGIRALQYIALMILTWPSAYVISYLLTKVLLDDD